MSLLRAASSISALTLASRILGLARDALSAWLLGAGPVAGAFHLAWMFPNLLRRLLGEGALSAAFVPAYAQSLARGDDEADEPTRDADARRLLSGVSGALVRGLGVTASVVVGLALVSLWTVPLDAIPGGSARLLVELTAILFPYVVPICWLAILAGAANAHGRFAAPAAAPILLNVFWIGGLATCVALGIGVPGGSDDDSLAAAARLVAVFLLVGGVVQLLVCGVRPLLAADRFAAPGRLDAAGRRVLYRTVPSALGLGVGQLNSLVDQVLAYFVVGGGANTYVYLANRLLLFPHALVALPIGVAAFPEFARLARGPAATETERHTRLRSRLARTSRISWALSVPAAVGLALTAPDLVRAFFERGRFGEEDTVRAAGTTIALVLGLPAVSLIALLSRVLYSFDAHASAARIAAMMAPLNLLLNVAFLAAGMREAGLALATSICSWVQFVLLAYAVERSVGHVSRPGGAVASVLRTLVATAVMAGVVLATQRALGVDARWMRLALPIAVGATAYAAAAWALGGPEVRSISERLRNRFAPRR